MIADRIEGKWIDLFAEVFAKCKVAPGDICAVLGLTVGELLAKAATLPAILTRAGERKVLNLQEGLRSELLIPFEPGNALEGAVHLVPPGCASAPLSHQGEEIAYVIRGILEANIGGEVYVIRERDSIHYRSELPHSFRNPGPKIAEFIVINTPPTF